MSYASGLEDIPQGSVGSRDIHNANMSRLDATAREVLQFSFPGDVQTGVEFGRIVLPFDVQLEAVTFNAYAGTLTADLTLQVSGPTTPITATIAAADNGYKRVITGSSQWVAAGTALVLQFTAGAGVQFPVVFLQLLKRKV